MTKISKLYLLAVHCFITSVSQKFCNILVIYLLCYNKSNLTCKVEAIILHHLKPSFCQFFETNSCPLRQRTPSLKLPHPLGYQSVTSVGSEPWFRTSNNLRTGLYAGCGISLIPSSFWNLFPIIWVVWGLALSCFRRAHFLLANAKYFYHTMHTTVCSTGWRIDLEQTCELTLIISPEAERHLMYKM